MTLPVTDIRLKAAVDSGRIRSLLETKLQSHGKESALIDQLYISRVFPRDDSSYVIQYHAYPNHRSGSEPARSVFWGHLFPDGVDMPAYVAENQDKVILDPQIGLVIPLFPFDPSLPALAELLDLATLKVVLGNHNLLPECHEPASFQIKTDLLAYRLHRRCTLSIHLSWSDSVDTGVSTRRVIIRLSKPKRINAYRKALRRMNQSGFDRRANDRLTVPDVLAADEKKGLLFIEYVDGSSLHDMTSDGSFAQGCASAARLINKLHVMPLFDLPEYNWKTTLEELGKNINLVSALRPDLSMLLTESYSHLENNVDKVKTYEKTCIHRDYYDKQVLYSDDRITLLDCDTLAVGDPAQDCGNFLAHLMLRVRQEPNHAQNIYRGTTSFRQNYIRPGNNFQDRVRWWISATLVRLAVLYSLRPRWHHLSGEILEDAISAGSGEVQEKIWKD